MGIRTDSAEGWQYRVDRGTLLPAHRRDDGTLLVQGFAARECVLPYRRPDGSTFREFVPFETLHDSAGGLGRAPVTLEHPEVPVTPDNVGELGVGDTDGRVRVEDGGFVRVELVVRRRDAIQAVDAGKHELSPGYEVLVDPTPGVHPVHGAYDGVQVARRYNHLAIVDSARAGSDVRFRADAAIATESIRAPSTAANPSSGARAASKGALVNSKFLRLLTLLGVTSRIDTDDAAIDAACGVVEKMKEQDEKDAKARSDANSAAQAKLDAEKARADAEKVRADKAEVRVKELEAAEKAHADAAERAELDSIAKSMGIDTAKHADSLSLRCAIASKQLGSEVKADKGDAYLKVLVDMAKANVTKRGDGADPADGSGRAASADAWTQSGDNRGDSGAPPAQKKEYASPSQRSRQRADAAFQAARSGK